MPIKSLSFVIAVMAALTGPGVLAAPVDPAAADTVKTVCRGDDCVRWQCDDRGRDCFRLGYVDRRAIPVGTRYEETDAYQEPAGFVFGLRDPDNDYDSYPGMYDGSHNTLDPDNDYDAYPGFYSHYTNHFDPDNDYDSYPGF